MVPLEFRNSDGRIEMCEVPNDAPPRMLVLDEEPLFDEPLE
jgi:hypothetical protein